MKHGRNRFNPLARSNGEEGLKLNISFRLTLKPMFPYATTRT